MSLLLGTKLADLRKCHGFSQEALAEKMGVSRQAISKWERGESSPDTDTLITLAKLYEVSLDELVGHKQTENTESAPVKTQPENTKNPKGEKLYPGVSTKLLKFPFPLVVTAVYVLLGIACHIWHPTWLMFLLIPAYYHIAIGFRAKTKKGLLLGIPVFEAALILFLNLGLSFDAWKWAWILFIIAIGYYWGIIFYVKKHKD